MCLTDCFIVAKLNTLHIAEAKINTSLGDIFKRFMGGFPRPSSLAFIGGAADRCYFRSDFRGSEMG